jgi:hypothetical protein
MRRLALSALILAILGTGSALADIIKIGPPQPAHSWIQQWSENGILGGIMQPYNKVVVQMVVGGLEFLTPNTSGWTLNGTTMSLNGSQTGQFDFATTFFGTWQESVSFYYWVFRDDTLLSTQLLTWDPNTEEWSFEYPNNCVLPSTNVPEPGLVLLLGIGLIGVFLVAESCRS